MEKSSLSQLELRTRRVIKHRILPFLFILYIIAFLDRVNVSYAAGEMSHALGFTETVYATGVGIFFIGYFLLEVPSCLIVEKWSARRWIARIMIFWGLIAILMGFVNTVRQFYVLRFLLGAAEAGFFPGIIVYLHHWLPNKDRAKAVAMFMSAIPVSSILGAPVSGLLLGVHWLQVAGWRWLFILEGAPAVIFGVVTVFYLIDWPHQAKWLLPEERQWITKELELERKTKQESPNLLIAFKDLRTVFMTVAYFLIVSSAYGFIFFLPAFIKKVYGTSNAHANFITALPYTAALLAMLLVGWSSDRRSERHWHTAMAMLVGSTGLLLSALTQDTPALALAMFCVAMAGLYGYLPAFWTFPASYLRGTTAAATIGFINSIGNLGGFLGPVVIGYITETRKSSLEGLVFSSVLAFLAAILILLLPRSKNEVVAPQTATSF